MKKSESLRKLLHAMSGFGTAHLVLLDMIREYERTDHVSVNEIPGFTEAYPFHASIDELPVDNWAKTVIKNVRRYFDFKVLNYEYLNTGGNTMVGIFTIWLPALNQTVYALTNEIGCSITTVDYISNDIEIDDYDTVTIDRCDFDDLHSSATYFELYRHCLNEYTKSDCRYFGCTRAIPYQLLSNELQSKVDADYLTWCEENNQGCVPTNGRDIVKSPDYDPPVRNWDKILKDIKDFKDWHDATAGNKELYPHDYVITLADHTVRIPYGADEFSHIDDLLKNVIEEW